MRIGRFGITRGYSRTNNFPLKIGRYKNHSDEVRVDGFQVIWGGNIVVFWMASK